MRTTLAITVTLLCVWLTGCSIGRLLGHPNWQKETAWVQKDWYDDNWTCMRQSSVFTPQGIVTDSPLYAACLYAKGWHLTYDKSNIESFEKNNPQGKDKP